MNPVALLSLLRPGHWIKNAFVLAPAIFAGVILQLTVLWRVAVAALCFCLISSAVYCINDIKDYESDRLHPDKSRRPIASGAVRRGAAVCVAALLAVVSMGAAWMSCGLGLVGVLGGYLVMNIAYTWRLKRYPLVDITVIAIGFLLRLLAGSVAADCHLSAWIVIVTFLLALFLGLGKRREDVEIYESTGVSTRRTVSGYSLKFIDMGMSMVGAATLAAYFIYTVVPGKGRIITSEWFFLTGIPVTIGLLRYLQICVDTSKGGDHSVLMWKDRIILGSIIMYVVILIVLMICN